MAFPEPLLRLIQNLARLPGLGEKSATRLALYLLRRPEEEVCELAESLREMRKRVRLCERCFNFSAERLCEICRDPERDPQIICIVEDPAALSSIETSGVFRGLYHVLHGLLSPRDGIGPRELRLHDLFERLKREDIKEVLLALSPTVAGEATASYLAEVLRDFPVRITRLACGVPMGMDIRYADKLTLKRALEGRRPL
ncbi:MAG: recombination protein RecR [Thermodesulfobacteria bacterium]|nr:recombination protein RecR [Thermodesulfobacteriota bacterium]